MKWWRIHKSSAWNWITKIARITNSEFIKLYSDFRKAQIAGPEVAPNLFVQNSLYLDFRKTHFLSFVFSPFLKFYGQQRNWPTKKVSNFAKLQNPDSWIIKLSVTKIVKLFTLSVSLVREKFEGTREKFSIKSGH